MIRTIQENELDKSDFESFDYALVVGAEGSILIIRKFFTQSKSISMQQQLLT